MDPLKELFESGQTILWIETQNTVAFFRPVPDVLVWTPCPTACMTEPLCFGQVRFAALQLLSQLLLFGHIHGGSKKPFENPVLEDWNTNASNIANRAVRSNDPLLYVATGTLLTYPLYGLCHEVAVLRVNGGQVLLDRRGSLLRVEAIDLKQFPRPILKKTRRTESPAPRMTETLPFCEIKLALPKRFLGMLAVSHVLDRSEHSVGPARGVSFHITLKVGDAHFARWPEQPTFSVKAGTAESLFHASLPIFGVDLFLARSYVHRTFLRPHSIDAIGLIRPVHPTR